MPATTTAVNACNAKIWLDNASGVPVDVSRVASRINMDFTQDLGTFKVFGDKWTHRLACAKDATFSLDVVYSTADNEAVALLTAWFTSGGKRTLRVMLPEDAVGNDDYTAEVFLSSLSIPVDAGEAGPITVTAELMPDGEVAFATLTT